MNILDIDDSKLQRFDGWRFLICAGSYDYHIQDVDSNKDKVKTYSIEKSDAGHMELHQIWKTQDRCWTYTAPEVLLKHAYTMHSVDDDKLRASDVSMQHMIGYLQGRELCMFSSLPVVR